LGATGTPVTASELASLLASFPSWKQCTGTFEPLLIDTEDEAGPAEERWSASPFDDVVGYLSHVAFAWLTVATPVSDDAVKEELDRLRRELFRLHQSGQVSESDAIERERKQKRFRELSRAGTAGIWDVAIAVGTKESSDTARVASVLCTAAEQSASSYKIRPVAESSLASPEITIGKVDPLAFRTTVHLVAALVRPPESEIPGFRAVVPPSFDTTPEIHKGSGDGIELCTVLDRFLQSAGPLSISLDTLNRHTFVCGATGAGKSQTIRGMLESLARRPQPIPWLVIEPAKAEYARMSGRLKGVASVLRIRPGDRKAPPASINPLEPASLEPGNPDRTFPLQGHADLVRALFLAAFQAEEPFPQVLSRGLVECYTRGGWDLVSSEPLRRWDSESGQPSPWGVGIPRYPSLANLQRMASEVVEGIGYDEDIKKRVRGFVDVRIGSLRLGAPGRFFEGGHPLDVAELLRRNVVFELETITNDQDKAFVMGAILVRVYEQFLLEEKERFTRDGGPAPFRHLTVIEEAHRLLRNVVGESPSAHSLELFASLLAEVRAYGEGIVVAEQIPSKLIPDVIKNTALKVVHRLPAADDREAVGATMNLSDEQSKYVVSLEPGVGAIFSDGMDRPVLGRITASPPERESDATVELVPPVQLGLRRSYACGHECKSGAPCTLLQMRRAERLVGEHPELTLWAEVSCSAHLIGYFSPGLETSPAVQDLRQLLQKDPRLVECAVGYGVEQAIGARYHGLSVFFDPDSLARHVALAGIAAIRGSGLGEICGADRGRWRAGRQRFADVESWLAVLVDGGTPKHSQTEAMKIANSRGLFFKMGRSREQLTYIRGLSWRRISAAAQADVLTGNAMPRLLRAAADLTGTLDDANECLARAFKLLRWGNPTDGVTLREAMLPPIERKATAEVVGAKDGR
jgi:DNA helicase HerA-like ATPase